MHGHETTAFMAGKWRPESQTFVGVVEEEEDGLYPSGGGGASYGFVIYEIWGIGCQICFLGGACAIARVCIPSASVPRVANGFLYFNSLFIYLWLIY